MKGTLIKLSKLNHNFDLKDIKILVSNYIKPIFIDYNKNQNFAILRFAFPLLANEFFNVFNQKQTLISDIEKENIVCEKIQGKEEEDYLQKVQKLINDFQEKKKKKKQNK